MVVCYLRVVSIFVSEENKGNREKKRAWLCDTAAHQTSVSIVLELAVRGSRERRELRELAPTFGIGARLKMTRDSSASEALVPAVSAMAAAVTTTATAAAGNLPFPLLTRTNYAAWAMRMKYLLRANGA